LGYPEASTENNMFSDGYGSTQHNARNLESEGTPKYHEILTFTKAKIVGSEVI
jgi:hypothetical protein